VRRNIQIGAQVIPRPSGVAKLVEQVPGVDGVINDVAVDHAASERHYRPR
jgi:hypothetical protein